MGTPSQSYVDPSIAGNSGTGVIGDPWGDLQYALDEVTRDAANGDQINVKAGTDEILAATLDFSTYGAATDAAPIIFRGYTSAANDGGIGGIDGNDGDFLILNNYGFIQLIDMHLHNTGTAGIVEATYGFFAEGCEFNNAAGILVKLAQPSLITSCYLHDGSGTGVQLNAGGAHCVGNYFANGTKDFSQAISILTSSMVIRNILSLDGASVGIALYAVNSIYVARNSILSAAGTGKGISTEGVCEQGVVHSNVVEGFSGVGGVGINLTSAEWVVLFGHNAVYNCTDDYVVTGDEHDYGDNEDTADLGASPFAKSGADTFANRFTYFSPADVGNVRGGAYPSGCRLDKGAVQHADPAGALAFIQSRRNTLIGR